jgi:hypothetical protein
MESMTKNRMALIAVFLIAIAVILGALVVLLPRPGVTKANFDRIESGMTKTKVEQIFGRPSDKSGPADRPNTQLDIWFGNAERNEMAIVLFEDLHVDKTGTVWQGPRD